LQNRTSPPFLKEVAEARSRKIREINPPESPFRQGGRALMSPLGSKKAKLQLNNYLLLVIEYSMFVPPIAHIKSMPRGLI